MRKLWFLLALLATVFVAACSPAAGAPVSTATLAPTATRRVAALPTSPPARCTVESSLPKVSPTEAVRFAPVSAQDWVDGPANARVTILEYSDFMCPYCAIIAPVLAQIRQDYPNDVRIVFRHFPLRQHDKALLAAQAAEAAGLQDKFWQMEEFLLKDQPAWTGKSVTEFQAWLVDQAAALGLDKARFTSDLTSKALVDKVAQAQVAAETAQVDRTPYIVLNDRVYPDGLPLDYETLTSMIKLIQVEDRQYSNCPAMSIDPKKQYTATLKTGKGNIVIQLLPDKAPMAVNSFIFLAKEGWFNGVTFHRVEPNFVAQSGDPTGTGLGGPGYAFSNEISDLRFDREGLVGMANAGPDTNGSQFFITMAPAASLDGQYTIFGQVIQGMEVVRQLTPRNPNPQPGDPTPAGGVLPPGDKILEVTIEEK